MMIRKKSFDHFINFQKKKKNNIGDELERLVNKSLDLKNKVNTKGRLFRSDSKAAKVKDTFDSVLQVTYPYISEAKGWSSAKTKVSSRSSKMHIQVMPKFVPFGFEDATEVKTGVKVNKGETAGGAINAKLWRDEKFIYSQDKNNWIQAAINSESELISMEISQYQDILVLDSDDLVSKKLGKVLGQFYFEPEIHCYKQSGSAGTYMFHMKGHGWFVGPDPDKPDGWLKNSSDSKKSSKIGMEM